MQYRVRVGRRDHPGYIRRARVHAVSALAIQCINPLQDRSRLLLGQQVDLQTKVGALINPCSQGKGGRSMNAQPSAAPQLLSSTHVVMNVSAAAK